MHCTGVVLAVFQGLGDSSLIGYPNCGTAPSPSVAWKPPRGCGGSSVKNRAPVFAATAGSACVIAGRLAEEDVDGVGSPGGGHAHAL